MLADTTLAIAHHLLAFGLAGLLVAQFVVLGRAGGGQAPGVLSNLDRMYGAASVLLIVAGVARVILGVKGAGFYLHNPAFWAKMAVFLVVGLVSVVPTIAFVRWAKLPDGPSPEAIRRVRRWVGAELLLFPLIPALAAIMARWAG